ncbi:MAG: hypothetical protein WCS37_10670 [Chloroflexota bacterium]
MIDPLRQGHLLAMTTTATILRRVRRIYFNEYSTSIDRSLSNISSETNSLRDPLLNRKERCV